MSDITHCVCCDKPVKGTRGFKRHLKLTICGESYASWAHRVAVPTQENVQETTQDASMPEQDIDAVDNNSDLAFNHDNDDDEILNIVDPSTGKLSLDNFPYQPSKEVAAIELAALVEEEDDEDDSTNVVPSHLFQRPEGFDQDYLLNTQQNYSTDAERVQKMESDAELQSDLALLKLLQGHPLALFEQIRRWRYDSEFKYHHKMDHSYPDKTRNKVVKDLEAMYQMENLRPRIQDMQLPNTGANIKLPLFSFGEMVRNMLSNPAIFCQENVNFDFDNPFEPPKIGGNNNMYGDVNTGSLFVDAYHRVCKDPQKDIMAGLIGFCDKSHLDLKGKLTLEPMLFTFGFFNAEFRRRPEAWFPLGYLPNMNHVSPHAEADDKMRDYHHCLEIILSELVEYQKLGGFHWRIWQPNQKKYVDVRIHIPILYIIGDTEGQDYLCGRKKSPEGPQCRMCNVLLKQCDDPYTDVVLTARALIAQYRTEKNQKALDELSYKLIDDAFKDVEFADMIHGIFSGTPAECLHAVNLGMQERIIICCFLMKRIKQDARNKKKKQKRPRLEANSKQGKSKSRRRHRKNYSWNAEWVAGENDQEEQQIYVPPELQDYSIRGIFDKGNCEKIDQRCKELNAQLRWQSARDLPRTNFPTGISSISKMTGSERNGVLLMLLLIITMDSAAFENRIQRSRDLGRAANPEARAFRPSEHGYISYCMTKKLKQAMIKHISLLLLFDSFVRCEHIPVESVDRMELFVKQLVEGITLTFPRYVGKGHKTIKTHLVSHHMIPEIKRSGSLQNSNSGPCESNHIEHVKIVGRNTQKRAATFDEQTANQAHNKRVIDTAYKDHPDWNPSRNTNSSSVSECIVGAVKYSVWSDAVYKTKTRKTNVEDEIHKWTLSGINGVEMLSLIREKILPNIEEDFVTLHFQVKQGNNTYHANPCYGESEMPKQHWALISDFILKEDGHYEERKIGFHLQFIVHIPSKPCCEQGYISFDCGSCIYSPGYYMIGHRLTKVFCHEGKDLEWNWDHGTLAEENQHVIHMACKETITIAQTSRKNGRTINRSIPKSAVLAVPVGRIRDTLIGLRDPAVPNVVDQFYYFIESPARWSEIFIRVGMEETATLRVQRASQQEDDDEEEESDEEESEEESESEEKEDN